MMAEDGYPPLHTALLRRDIAAVRAALNAPVTDPFELSVSGDAPIHVAALCGDAEMVKLVLESMRAAKPQSSIADLAKLPRSRDEAPPILLAAFAGNVEATKALLEAGVGTPDSGILQQAILVALDDNHRSACLATHDTSRLVSQPSPSFPLTCVACGRRNEAPDSASFYPASRCDECHLTVCAACLPRWTKIQQRHFEVTTLLVDAFADRQEGRLRVVPCGDSHC
jgi:ankyrin repeat protein